MSNLVQKLMLGSSAAALISAVPVSGAMAQGEIEQVVVSASRITIAGYQSPTPVTVVGAAELERNAYSQIIDSIKNLPQVTSNPGSYGRSQGGISGGNIGASTINLRFLGDNRTLVLFDGQRVASLGIGGSVDINLLPSSVVSRVDVVTGGASAAWGSDAVAGVVNFVINKNFSGFRASVEGGSTTNGLDRSLAANAAWGGDVFGGRGHLMLAASASLRPDWVLLSQENWYRSAYWVSNPAYVAGSSQPQLIVANNVGYANMTPGGIINASPAGTAGPGVTPAPANALRGIQFVGNGIPQLVNYGNITSNALSNGGSLDGRNSNAPMATLASPNNAYVFFGHGRYKLTDTITASLQINAGYTTAWGVAGGALQSGLLIKSDNAFIPASVRATMQAGGITSFTLGTFNNNNYNNYTARGDGYAARAQGALQPAIIKQQRVFQRGVFTLDGTLGDDWAWNAYIQNSGIKLWSVTWGTPITANLLAAQDAVSVTTANRGTSGLPLGSIVCRSSLPGQAAVVSSGVTAQPGCIPLNVFGEGVASPGAIAYVTGQSNKSYNTGFIHTEQDVAEASVQGVLPWELPAGKVAVAFGAGYRKEAANFHGNPVSHLGGWANGNFALYPPSHYTTLEGFAQVDAPILKNSIVSSLDFSMAGRITDYSTSGMVETWKLGATSQVNDDIKLRATWSVDIRAPSIQELFNPGSQSQVSLRDPKTQATVTAVRFTTGNPNLVPEVARTISGGVVLTPTFLPGFSLSADWYSINLTGAISQINDTDVTTQCNASLPSVLYPGTNGNPNDPLCALLIFNGPGGALSGFKRQPINIASQSTSGLDLQANYTMELWGGTLDLASTSNLNDQSTFDAPGVPPNDLAGTSNYNGGQFAIGPKWKGTVSATYSTGPYSSTLQARWLGTSKITNLGNTGNLATASTANLYDPNFFHTPFMGYLDWRGSYKWNDNIQIFGAIDNVFNNPPGLIPGVSNALTIGPPQILQTNPSVWNMLGRTIRAGVRFSY